MSPAEKAALLRLNASQLQRPTGQNVGRVEDRIAALEAGAMAIEAAEALRGVLHTVVKANRWFSDDEREAARRLLAVLGD